MTDDSLELSELSEVVHDAEGVRRDRWGGYLLVPPGGGKPVAHRRTSTVIKALDSEGGLLPWHGGRVILGAIRDPALWRKARKLTRIGEHDPWYEGGKAEYKQLLGELADAGGRHARADLGTYLHGVAERWLRSGELPDDPAALAWLEAYRANLERHGIVIDPNYLEVIVVRDGERIAGKVDYLRVMVPGYELPMIGDLKTGTTLDYSLAGYTIQTACYRGADAIAVQGAADDGSDDERHPLPELDNDHAVLLHAPAGSDELTVYVVDLEVGRQGLATALAVEAWRKRHDHATVLEAPGALLEALSASVASLDEARAARSASVVDRAPQPQPATNGAELRAWLQARINLIGRHEAARRTLVTRWPVGLPTLGASDAHTDEQLLELERHLDATEAKHSLPFGPTRPNATEIALQRIAAAFPGSVVMTEPQPTQPTHTGATA